MSRFILSISLVGLIVFQSNSQSPESTQYQSDAEKMFFYTELAKKYNSDALSILGNDEKLRYMAYSTGSSTFELIRDYNVVIHESVHGLNNSRYSWSSSSGEKWNINYFVNKDIYLKVRQDSLVGSYLMSSIVPEDQQLKIGNRYDVYITQSAETRSSISGIFQLINEYSAYYHGNKASIELFTKLKEFGYTSEQLLEYWRHNIEGTITAYYEFRLFISWYLFYVKNHYISEFNFIMENQNLRVAFTLLDNDFKELMFDYSKFNYLLLDELKKFEIEAEILDGDLVIQHELSPENKEFLSKAPMEIRKSWEMSNRTVYTTRLYQIEYLQSIMTPELEQLFQNLKIQNLNQSNYKSFMEK